MKMYAVFYVVYGFLIAGLQNFAQGLDDISANSIESNSRPLVDKWETNRISPDDIRCFCNLPQCVSTGYMCRTARSGSSSSGCFSEIREPTDKSATRHGCVELLKSLDQPMQCDNSPRKHNNMKAPNGSPSTDMLLLCCQEDLCNHVDNPEYQQKIKLEVIDNSDITNPGRLSTLEEEIESRLNIPMLQSPEVSNNEAWFRVATIAVPICGAIILFSLIAVAIKILRSERISSPSSKLDGGSNEFGRKFPIDHEAQTLKHSPHLYRYSSSNNHYTSDLCDKKNETRAKINQLMNLEYSLLPQSCSDPLTKPNNTEPCGSNLYKNVNISLDSTNRNKDHSDKIYDKEVLSPITANWSNTSGCSSGATSNHHNNNNNNNNNNNSNNSNTYKSYDEM